MAPQYGRVTNHKALNVPRENSQHIADSWLVSTELVRTEQTVRLSSKAFEALQRPDGKAFYVKDALW